MPSRDSPAFAAFLRIGPRTRVAFRTEEHGIARSAASADVCIGTVGLDEGKGAWVKMPDETLWFLNVYGARLTPQPRARDVGLGAFRSPALRAAAEWTSGWLRVPGRRVRA